MADGSWTLIFRSYSADELTAHIAKLKSEMTVFASATVGSKSYTKDLRELKAQLEAAIFVQRQRNPPPITPPVCNFGEGVTDFSKV